jgi:hypothetical protein
MTTIDQQHPSQDQHQNHAPSPITITPQSLFSTPQILTSGDGISPLPFASNLKLHLQLSVHRPYLSIASDLLQRSSASPATQFLPALQLTSTILPGSRTGESESWKAAATTGITRQTQFVPPLGFSVASALLPKHAAWKSEPWACAVPGFVELAGETICATDTTRKPHKTVFETDAVELAKPEWV